MLGIGLGGDDEEDVDPQAARIVARMRHIMLGSMAVMLLGIVVVLGVIVYRTLNLKPAAVSGGPEAPVAAATRLPPGSRILATTSDGQRLYVTVETPDGAEAIEVFDAAALTWRGRIALVPPRP
jgi:hypothetical protein